MRNIIKCFFLLLFGLFVISDSKGQSNYYINDTFEHNTIWINADYINCLETNLPCECQKKMDYFAFFIDTIEKQILIIDGSQNYVPQVIGLKNIGDKKYQITGERVFAIYFFYPDRSGVDTAIPLGSLTFKGDTLIYSGDTMIYPEESNIQNKFVYCGITEQDIYSLNTVLLNHQFKKKGYVSLSDTLNADSLLCSCDRILKRNDILSNKGEIYKIEKSEKELSIFHWINTTKEKRLIQKYDW
jgi:hypothetical protein